MADSGNYDLASGFQTLIKSHGGVEAEMRAMRTMMQASMDMAQKFSNPGVTAQRSAIPAAAPAADPNAGQTRSPGAPAGTQAAAAPRTFEGARQAAAAFVVGGAARAAQAASQAPDYFAGQTQKAAQAGARAAQPSSGPFGPNGPWGSSGGTPGWGGATPVASGSGTPASASPPGSVPPNAGGPGGGGPGPGGPVGGFLTRNIPGLGLLNRGLGELRSQQDKNNYYRNIEGGTHGNAMGERAREEAYVVGSQMVMGSDEARAAFKGVTRIGYTNRTDQRGAGTSRSEALDYVYEGKKSRGQSVGESLQQMEVASRSLNTSLGELNGAMERVSESAGKAGVNTEMARAQMLQNMSMGIAKGQGAGATGFAEAITSTNVSYGRDYAAQVSSSGMYSQDMEYRAAAMSGMNAGALRNQQRRDPVGAMESYQKVIDQSTSSASVTPEMKSWIKSKVQAEGGPDALRNNPTLADIIAGEFLDRFLGKEIPDPNAFANVMGSLAKQDFGGNVELAARFLVNQEAGNTMAANAKKNQMTVQKTDMSGKQGDGTRNSGMDKTLEEFGNATTSDGFAGIGRDQAKAAQSYAKSSRKSGQRDPVIEALLKNESLQGDSGDKAHVEVQTKQGRRVVSLDEAVREFPNQIAAGKAKFVDGAAKDKDVASLTGGKIRADADWQSEVRKESKTGVSLEDWDKKTGPAGKEFATIGLTPEAKKLVTYLEGGGPKASAAAAGVPPTLDPAGSPVGRGAAGNWGN